MNTHLTQKPEFIERFRRAAKYVRRIRNPIEKQYASDLLHWYWNHYNEDKGEKLPNPPITLPYTRELAVRFEIARIMQTNNSFLNRIQ